MIAELVPTKDDVEIELAKRNLIDFISYTKSDYVIKWYHEKIANTLDNVRKGNIKKLMIFVPPQHGKSEIATRRFPAHVLGLLPTKKIAICSYAASLATKFNRDIQRIIDSEEYIKVFPETYLNQSSVRDVNVGGYLRNTEQFETVGFGGFVKTLGVGGPLTGTPVDIGIVDDPIKDRVDAESENTRNKVWEWYTDVFETRLHNDSQQVVILTRWHHDDLAGRLLERDGDEWVVLKIPALKEFEDSGDPRQIGEALFPEKHSREKLEKIKKDTPYTFSSLYQQEPSPQDGAIWQKWFKPFREVPQNLSALGTDWDLAYTKDEKNSASAYVTSGMSDNKMYVTDLGYDYCEFPELIKMMKSKQEPHYIEAKASGKSAKQTLVSSRIPAIEVSVTGDKIARAKATTPYAESGMIYVHEDLLQKLYHDSKQGIIYFPNGKGNDLTDALGQAITRHFINKSGFRLI